MSLGSLVKNRHEFHRVMWSEAGNSLKSLDGDGRMKVVWWGLTALMLSLLIRTLSGSVKKPTKWRDRIHKTYLSRVNATWLPIFHPRTHTWGWIFHLFLTNQMLLLFYSNFCNTETENSILSYLSFFAFWKY